MQQSLLSQSEKYHYVVQKEMVHLEITALNRIIQAQEDNYHNFSRLWVLDFIDT